MEIEEALGIIASNARPIKDSIYVPIDEAYGYINYEDIKADAPVPAFARSAMDGYAVLASDVAGADREHPVRLRVTGEMLAGDHKDMAYLPSSAVRIMTGAMIPEGYDAVIMQEDTDYGEDEVNIYSAIDSHRNYIPVGEELKTGEVAIPAGRYIGRVEIGLMASLGMLKVKVRRPARTAIISTGSELADIGNVLVPGQIYGSILHMLKASVLKEKLEISYASNCPDDKEMICAGLKEAVSLSDLVITTGGVSVGKKDLIPETLEELGATRLFSNINIQPGTPTMASILDDKLILSLSGNPYAALANFDLYFWHTISKLMDCSYYLNETKEAVLYDRYDKVNRMRRLVRAHEADGKVYLPVNEHMSSVFGNMQECNCYMDIPAGTSVSPGDRVRLIKIRQM